MKLFPTLLKWIIFPNHQFYQKIQQRRFAAYVQQNQHVNTIQYPKRGVKYRTLNYFVEFSLLFCLFSVIFYLFQQLVMWMLHIKLLYLQNDFIMICQHRQVRKTMLPNYGYSQIKCEAQIQSSVKPFVLGAILNVF